jgi:hypothetical protein
MSCADTTTVRFKIAEKLIPPVYRKLFLLRLEHRDRLLWAEVGQPERAKRVSLLHSLVIKIAYHAMRLAYYEYEVYWLNDGSNRWHRFTDWLIGIGPPWHRWQSCDEGKWYVGRPTTPEEHREWMRKATLDFEARRAQQRLALENEVRRLKEGGRLQ